MYVRFQSPTPNARGTYPGVFGLVNNLAAQGLLSPGEEARHLMERVPGYLAILAAHGVECVRLESADPGKVIYEDDDQIVVVPRPAG
ncbi:hypothetical protein AB0392_45795 [Nonomuraea angiospora]|uniref:hypothetical protein n=1 Tax=Nonomuraea angiospora TaxID=46172 RepID=UPI00344E589F